MLSCDSCIGGKPRVYLTGRVRTVKTLALSKFHQLASVVTILEIIIKQVNRILYEFIWNDKTEKVKRSHLNRITIKEGIT